MNPIKDYFDHLSLPYSSGFLCPIINNLSNCQSNQKLCHVIMDILWLVGGKKGMAQDLPYYK